jgi:hypothetical protein
MKELNKNIKLNIFNFSLAGARLCALIVALITLAGIYNLLGGFPLLNSLLVDIYGKLGFSVSWLGVLLGAIYGFIDGFIFFGVFAWLYNKGCLLHSK